MTDTTTKDGHIEWFMERYRGFDRGEVSETTFDKREAQLRQFREWYGGDLSDVTGDDIEHWVMHLSGEGYGSKTIGGRRWALSKFFRQMKDKGRIEQNPMEQVAWEDISVASGKTRKKEESDENERIHPLSPDEAKALINNVPGPKVRNELLIRLMLQTGVRAHEAANITLERVNRDNRTIKVIDKKTGDSRRVAYQPSLAVHLRKWIDSGHRDVYSSAQDSDYLFVTHRSPKMDSQTPNKIVKQAADNAGIQEVLYVDAGGGTRYKVTAHTLRHTFAVEALKPGNGGGQMNLRYLQEKLGHDDITTTQDYLEYVGHDALEDMRDNGPSFTG